MTQPPVLGCERCGEPYMRTQPHRRFCSRRCQMNAYMAARYANDPDFRARARDYTRLWRVRERARRETQAALDLDV